MGTTDQLHPATGRKRVCLTGTFHSGNRGDASIQLAAVLELKRRWPGADITMLSPQPEDDAATYPGIRLIRTCRRRPLAAISTTARATLGGLADNDELRAMRAADLVIDLSGDGFTETFGWKCPASHSVSLLLARLLRRPFILMAQTIGPFLRHRAYYRSVLSRAEFLLCRDQETIDAMSKFGIPADHLALTADLAFLLPPESNDNLSGALPWLADFAAGAPLIGITPSNLHNISAIGDKSPMAHLAAVATALARASGGRILVIPTVLGPGPAYDDRKAAAALLDLLPADTVARICSENLSPRLIKSLIGRCDAYAGLRMHGLIAALSQSVPSIGVAYAGKTANLFRRMGIERFIIDRSVPAPLSAVEMADELWKGRAEIRTTISRSLAADILPAARANFSPLQKYLGQESAAS